MEGVLALLGPLPARLQADGISGVGARARRVLRERPAGSRQSFLGKPSPWEGGQHWSCGHGTCQAPGRASMPLCRASPQPGNAPTSPGCMDRLQILRRGLGTPRPGQQLPCALLCPGAQGRVGRGAGSAREQPGGIISNSSPSAKPLPQLHHFQPSLPVTEFLLSGLVKKLNFSYIDIFSI